MLFWRVQAVVSEPRMLPTDVEKGSALKARRHRPSIVAHPGARAVVAAPLELLPAPIGTL